MVDVQTRMANPAMVVPGAMDALLGLGKALHRSGVPAATLELVNLRASQINGCSVCVLGHAKALRAAGETDERLWSVAAWREAPWFTEAERAALALAESVTRLADSGDAVPDHVWRAASEHWPEPQLAALLLGIASVNLWNRLNAATRQEAGAVEW